MSFGAVYFRPLGVLLPSVDGCELHLSSQCGGEGRGTALNFQQLLPAEMWRALAVSGPVGIADGAGFDRGGAVCDRQTEAGRNWTPCVLALRCREEGKKCSRNKHYNSGLLSVLTRIKVLFLDAAVSKKWNAATQDSPSTEPFGRHVCTQDTADLHKCPGTTSSRKVSRFNALIQ